jgi:hypothetical protein
MQPIVIMGCSIVVVGDLVGNVPTGGVDDGTDSLEEYATSDNDN